MEKPPHPGPDLASGAGGSVPGNLKPGAAPDPSSLATFASPVLPGSSPNLTSGSLAALAERYEILGEAGRGAMGQVFKVRDRETGETVALKLLKPEIASDQAMVDRFKSELLFARKITHKNVCRVYEFNRVGGMAYTSMEFVEGESLRSVLHRFGSVTLRKGLDLALQMCSGLKEAHAQGIVHRDLKPENVMIDAQGNVKIMDFGIAHSMDALTRLTGAMTGTPAYMAPEQATGSPVDYRTDIYAFGLMLYEMFTGTQAFHADNAIALALKQINEQPAPPRGIEPSIPGPIERAILKCVEKEPDKRFQSIAELESVLRSQAGSGASGQTAYASSTAATQRLLPSAVAVAAQPSSAPRKPSKTWVAVLGSLVVLAAVGAVFAWRGMARRNPAVGVSSSPVETKSTNMASPAPPPAIPENAPAAKPEVASKTSAKPATPKPASVRRTAAPPKPTEMAASAAPVPFFAGAHSDAAASPASTPAPAPASQAGPPAITTGPGKAASYIWVGRFLRDVGAQSMAKKIEDLGLPVAVFPRHNAATNEDFFVVFAGPFPPDKIDAVLQQLLDKGFKNARLNARMPRGPQEQAP